MKKTIAKRKRYKLSKKVLFLFLSFLLVVLLFLTSGRFLLIHETPQQVDAIIVLSGGSGRVEKAVELYKAGYAPYIILSNSKESTGVSGDMLQTALDLGIPQDVLLTEDAALSTYQNAEFTLPIMKEHGFTSAIIVSSDFHMRRVKFIFDHVYKKSGIELTYVGSDSAYNAKYWWSDPYSRETTFNEYTKMVGNAFGYNGPEAKNALDQIKSWFH